MWPSFVNNGQWTNCNFDNKKQKARCDLTCNDGHIPDGNGKWVCEKEKISHPVHSCKRVQAPQQQYTCQTPQLDHGVYACAWTEECHDKHYQGKIKNIEYFEKRVTSNCK